MDKVMIDGVDVSGCIYYNSEKFANCGMFALGDFKCEGQICLFKQLKRARAEYDDLHLSYAGCKTANTGLKELNQKLEQENEILKEKLQISQNSDKKTIEIIKENERLKEENNDLCKALKDKEFDRLIQSERKLKNLKQANNYKQALQEIREIVSEPCIVDENCQTCNSGCMQKDILTKINEVIGAEE